MSLESNKVVVIAVLSYYNNSFDANYVAAGQNGGSILIRAAGPPPATIVPTSLSVTNQIIAVYTTHRGNSVSPCREGIETRGWRIVCRVAGKCANVATIDRGSSTGDEFEFVSRSLPIEMIEIPSLRPGREPRNQPAR